ncbi:MAG: ATP-binding protein [Nitrospinota bacterium]
MEAEDLEREVRRLGGTEESLKGALPEREKRLDELRGLISKAARKRELERELEENLRRAEGVDSRLNRISEIRDELEAIEKSLEDLAPVADSARLIRDELPRWEGELESLALEEGKREREIIELKGKLKGLRQEREPFKELDPYRDEPSVLEEETLLRLDLKREELTRQLTESASEESPLPSSLGIALAFALGLFILLAPTILKHLLGRPLPPYGMVLYALGLLPIYWSVLQLNRRLFIAKARSTKSEARKALEDKLAEVEGELQKLFSLLGCSGIEEARAIRIRMRELLRLQEEATRELERLEEEGLRKEARAHELRSKVEALLSRTGADDPQSLKGLLSQCEELTRQRELLLTQRREIESEEGEGGLKREQEALDRRRRELRLDLEEGGLQDFRPSMEEEEAWKREAKELEESLRKDEQELLFTQGRLRELAGKLRSPDAIREEIEEVEERISELDFLYQAHLLAEETLREAWAELEGEYLPSLEQKLNYYFRRAVPEEFTGVELTRTSHNRPQVILKAWGKEDIRVEALSHATADQLYLSLRLALLELLSPGGTPPLFLDDPLTNFDPASLDRVWPLLSEWASTHQLLFLSCHPQYLERGEGLRREGVPVKLFHFEGPGKLKELPLS